MLIDLHVYTQPSGGPTLWDAVESAQAAHLDGILVADKRASAATAMAVKNGDFDSFKVFVGVEIATRTGDIILIPSALDPFLTREEWRQLDTINLPTLEEVRAFAQQEDAAILIVHPYERRRKNAPRDRIFAMEDIQAIEVANSSANYIENHIATEAMGHAQVPAFAGSASLRKHQNQWATLFARQIKDQADLVTLLREGNFWPVELGVLSTPQNNHRQNERRQGGNRQGGNRQNSSRQNSSRQGNRQNSSRQGNRQNSNQNNHRR